MAYRTIIFDLDGTLADTSPGIIEATRMLEQKMGLPPIPEQEMKSIIGPPLYQTFSRTYTKDEDTVNQLIEIYRHIYNDNDMARKVFLYPGMRQLLDFLREQGLQIAVATMKIEQQTRHTLESLGLSDFFDLICCYDEDNRPTKAQLIQRVMDTLGVTDRSTVLMVGDSIYDSEGAAQTGIDFAAMTSGFGFADPEALSAFPSVIEATDVSQLADYIKANMA